MGRQVLDRSDVTVKTLSKVKVLGARGNFFKSHEVREALEYGEDSQEAHYMHNILQRLKTQGIIQPVASDTRRRHQHLQIVDEAGLRKALDRAHGKVVRGVVGAPTAANGSSQDYGSAARLPVEGPRRVMFLEERVDRIEHTLEDLTTGIDDLRKQMKELIDLWS